MGSKIISKVREHKRKHPPAEEPLPDWFLLAACVVSILLLVGNIYAFH